MKSFVKIISLLFVYMFCTSCTSKWNNEKVAYYLSQPRDPELTGWWKMGGYFWNLKSTGTIAEMTLLQYNGEYFVDEDRFYWHTEKKSDTEKIFHHFNTAGWMDKKYEINAYYMVRNDSLWLSSNIEGNIDGFKLFFVGTRCDEPKEYKDARRAGQ